MHSATLPAPALPAAPDRDFPRLRGGVLQHVRDMRRDPLEIMVRARRECGDVARVQFGPQPVLILSHPRHVDQVLVRGAEVWGKDTRGQRLLREILGLGLLTAQGDLWRRNRRIANPAFTRRAIGGFARTMTTASQELAADWAPRADGRTEVDVALEMNHLALRIAGETLFGQDVGQAQDAVGHGLEVVLDEFIRISTLPWPWMMHLPTPRNLRLKRAMAQLDAVVSSIITARRAEVAEGEPRPDLLGMLMAAEDDDGVGLSDKQLRDEVLTMLLAGHETTANALAWTLMLLGRHPQVQERLAAELTALGDGPLDMKSMGALPYTRQVLQESMRLYPPAWVTSRAATVDTEIDGVPVAKGTFAFMSSYVIQRHPDVWPDPEAFLPDRWADERPLGVDGQPVPKNASIPFGAGQRKCIGSHFAMMEATIVLATLLRRYRVSLAPGHPVELHASVTLRPRHGIRMVLHPRESGP